MSPIINFVISLVLTIASTILINLIQPKINKLRKGIVLFLSILAGIICFYFLPKPNQDTKNAVNKNPIIINKTTINNDNSVTNIYYITDNKTDEYDENFKLIALNALGSSYYLDTETFSICHIMNNDEATKLDFKLINHNPSKNTEIRIKWGDGTPNKTITNLDGNTNLSHNFPSGNTIIQIQNINNNKVVSSKNYNVFMGTMPSLQIRFNGKSSICLKDSLEFIMEGFENNPPWTLYKLIVDDGSDPISFINPKKKSIKFLHKFKSIPKKKINPKNKYSVTLVAENPCGSSAVSTGSIIHVIDCGNCNHD